MSDQQLISKVIDIVVFRTHTLYITRTFIVLVYQLAQSSVYSSDIYGHGTRRPKNNNSDIYGHGTRRPKKFIFWINNSVIITVQ